MEKTIIVITGTPGAGKTTVLNEALSKIDGEIKVINYAEIMLAIGKEIVGSEDHDLIRKLPVEEQKKLQKAAAEKISNEASGITIVDTHSTINTKNGYLPGLPEWVIKALSPKTIVLIEADPEEIAGRRAKDKSRQRDQESINMIKLQQDVNRMSAFSSAVLCGATVKIIKNHDNGLEEAADELVRLIK